MEIKPILMDSEKEDFVIFRVNIEDKPDAYVWVNLRDDFKPERDMRMTSFYGLASYCTHTGEPFYAGEFPEDMLKIAEERLFGCPDELKGKMLESFNSSIEGKKNSDESWEDYSKWEEEAMRDVERAKNSENGLVSF